MIIVFITLHLGGVTANKEKFFKKPGILNLKKWFQGCEIIDNSLRIDGKVVLITGANSGIGLVTAIELASRGALVHMACRDGTRCKQARDEVFEELGKRKIVNGNVFTHSLDLAKKGSIRQFVVE